MPLLLWYTLRHCLITYNQMSPHNYNLESKERKVDNKDNFYWIKIVVNL